jgi:hypothetical protein
LLYKRYRPQSPLIKDPLIAFGIKTNQLWIQRLKGAAIGISITLPLAAVA